MSKLDIEKITRLTKQVFFGSVSTAFVHDCLNYILHSVKLSQHHHCSIYSEVFSIIV